jgi:chemotaxis methyl-accepting protein methylase
VGCGIGLWREVIEREFPGAEYEGMEVSEYLCDLHGWRRGNIADFRSRKHYDLVICQGVLQYLDAAEAKRAMENLAQACRGALYLEALTREDWDNVADQSRTDGDTHLRSARWYRKELRPKFAHVGGGVWLSPRAEVPLYELEKG